MNHEQRREQSSPMIGEVYMMQFDGSGSEQGGWRPGVVFQNNKGNSHSPNIIALPLTTALKKSAQPTHVVIDSADSGLRKTSMVLCENPQRLSKRKVGPYITSLSEKYMRQIAVASLMATSIISYLSVEDLIDAHGRSVKLNSTIRRG